MTKNRIGLLAVLIAAGFAFALTPASARTESITHGGTYYGTNVIVGPNEEIDGMSPCTAAMQP